MLFKLRWHLSVLARSQSANLPERATETKTSGRTEDSEDLSLVRMESNKDPSSMSLSDRIRSWLRLDINRIKSLGIGAILSYSFLSNVNSGICFTVAWLTHVKQTGTMPFAAGQWKKFVAIYVGLWTVYSFLRPLRIALAIALTPFVNRMMDYLVQKLAIQRRQAFFVLLIALFIFTVSSFAMAIWILGGIPTKPTSFTTS
eukprot:g469.t1